MTRTHAASMSQLYAGWNDRKLSDKALSTAKLGFVDIVGCIVAGAPTETASMVRDLACAQGRVDEASLLGTQLKLSAPLAALVNGVAGHVLDYDDMNSTLIGHPSVVLVPALLALGESRATTGRELLAAYILGFEITAHLARVMVPYHYNAGWHSTSSLGIFGAAAAAARLLGLSTDKAMHAVAIVASNSSGIRGNFGSMTKSLHAGQAAEGALRAALLAERGFTGNLDVFDAVNGYIATYGKNPEPKPAPQDDMLEIESSGISIKPYACCGAGISVIDAALDLRAAHPLDPSQIASVDCTVAELATSIMPFSEASDGLQAKYCLPYCAAVALLDNRGGLAQFEDERVNRDDVKQLAKNTRVRSDSRMPSAAGKFGIEMRVTLRNGAQFTSALEIPRGHATRPIDDATQLDKFLECAAPVIGESRAREATGLLRSLEQQRDLKPLIELLRA